MREGTDRAANSLFRQATQPGPSEWIHVQTLEVPEYADTLIGTYYFERGEAETLALAVELEPDYLVIDEGRAWEAAEEVCPHLTIIALSWLLDEAQVRGLIPSSLQALRGFELARRPAGEPAYRSAHQVRQAHLRYRAGGGMGLPPKPR